MTLPKHLLLLLYSLKGVSGAEVRISNASEFKNFANNVNTRRHDYSGTTVFLDSDLSLSGITEPIGTRSYYFHGTFDGQGHIISNLEMISSSQFTGLFGYSEGLTIRNLVLDSSCSITNPHSGSNNVYVGGVIGYCSANSGQCNIENNVNMADIKFSGTISNYCYLYLGGIAGKLYYHSYPIYVKNCANYGSVTLPGNSYCSFVGGIVGHLEGSSSYYQYIYNCLNYGTITYSGTASLLYVGGVSGYSYRTYIENCVSDGKIVASNAFVGSFVGYVDSGTYISYCYYTSELNEHKLYGRKKPKKASYTLSYNNVSFELNGVVSVGSYTGNSLVDALNAAADYYALRDYSSWLLNKEEKSVTFTINSRTNPITMNSQLILLPSLASEGKVSFDGWYSDSKYTDPLKYFEIIGGIELYGRFETGISYAIVFDFSNGTILEHIVGFNEEIDYPTDVVWEGYKFVGWDKVGIERMPARNFTVTALWKSSSSPFLVLTMGITVSILLAVIVVHLVVVTLIHKKFKKKTNKRMFELSKPLVAAPLPKGGNSNGSRRVVSTAMDEIECTIPAKASMSVLTRLYTKGYVRPTMKEALADVDLTEKQVEIICNVCDGAATTIAEKGRLFDEFTRDDAAAIAMYTYDFGPNEFECNPYRIINRSIVERNYASMQKASGLLYLVMCALRKLPRVTGETLYRGVRSEVNLDKDHYHKGNIITWPALSSTSPDVDTTKRFLANGSKSGEEAGTLFIIEDGWGYDIQPYSLFPDEAEILVEPERQFEVVSVDPSPDLTVINLKMLDTPLILPHVFGDVWR